MHQVLLATHLSLKLLDSSFELLILLFQGSYSIPQSLFHMIIRSQQSLLSLNMFRYLIERCQGRRQDWVCWRSGRSWSRQEWVLYFSLPDHCGNESLPRLDPLSLVSVSVPHRPSSSCSLPHPRPLSIDLGSSPIRMPVRPPFSGSVEMRAGSILVCSLSPESRDHPYPPYPSLFRPLPVRRWFQAGEQS